MRGRWCWIVVLLAGCAVPTVRDVAGSQPMAVVQSAASWQASAECAIKALDAHSWGLLERRTHQLRRYQDSAEIIQESSPHGVPFAVLSVAGGGAGSRIEVRVLPTLLNGAGFAAEVAGVLSACS